jgi:hypothetical protein
VEIPEDNVADPYLFYADPDSSFQSDPDPSQAIGECTVVPDPGIRLPNCFITY